MSGTLADGAVLTIAALRSPDAPATISVPEAGQVLGIGRDAAYAAAERGDIPALRLGRSRRVPVHRFLELLVGSSTQTNSDADGSTPSTSAQILTLTKEKHRDLDGTPPPAA